MSDPLHPLPLDDVMDIVDRRKRRRVKLRAATVSAAAVAGLGAAGVGAVVVFAPADEAVPVMPAAAGEASGTPADIDLGPVSDTMALDAFFAAGYSYDDSLVIAAEWGLGVDFAAAKIEAGRYLAQGVSLEQTPYGNPSFDDGYDAAYLADYFYSAGYSADDAATLARQWGIPNADAAARGGSELKVNLVVPFVDPPINEPQSAVDAYWAQGCNTEEALILAEFWDLADPFDAKIKAGQLLLDGKPLPVTTPILACAPTPAG